MTGKYLSLAVFDWYQTHARDLPWRSNSASPWAVMVSEIMLQQTPVARVMPVYDSWLTTWPTSTDLANATSGDAVRAWGRLGYPRRALRLHAAATMIRDQHAGQVPHTIAELRALPGVGEYTAAAIASFAFGQSHAVLDTNVRRVLHRVFDGGESPPPSLTNKERRRATALLPTDRGAEWSVGVMELGALVCTARNPQCANCPIVAACAWHTAGRPPHSGQPRKAQTYAGTDRQCRGRLLAVLRDAPGTVNVSDLIAAWDLDEQRDRALASLLDDGLVICINGRYGLP